jgi:hypothetical protein
MADHILGFAPASNEDELAGPRDSRSRVGASQTAWTKQLSGL